MYTIFNLCCRAPGWGFSLRITNWHSLLLLCRYVARYGALENEVQSMEEGLEKYGDKIDDGYKYNRVMVHPSMGQGPPA